MKERKKSKWLLTIPAMLLVLLLSLCSALSCGIWCSAKNCITETLEEYKSLAWLKESEFLPNSKYYTQLYPYCLLQKVHTLADSSSYADSVDIRFQCMAHAGLNTVVSDECGVSVHSSVDKPYKDSVIVGTCEAIEFKSISQTEKSSGNISHFGYIATIKIDKNLSPVLDPDYPYSYVRVMSSQIMADFSHFFVVGSKYIINGAVSYLHTPFKEDQAPYFTMAETDFLPPVTEIKFEEYMYEKIGVPKGTKIITLHGRPRDLTYCYLAAYTDLSYLSYAKIDNSLEEFLSSDENSTWNTIIADKKTAKESVKIVTANNIRNIPHFQSGRAYITQGVPFTEEDYMSGKKICLISEQLAKSNDIKIGDVLELRFWNIGYELQTPPSGASWSPKTEGCKSALSDSENYTVTGIYTDNNGWDTQCYDYTPNVVFVPELSVNDLVKAQPSLTVFDNDKYTGIPDSRTYILKNGKASAFEAEMEALGYGGRFYYYEKDVSFLPYLYSLSDKSQSFSYTFTVAFAVVVIVMAIYAFIRNILSTDKKPHMRAILTVIIIVAASILISAVICISFYGSVIIATNEYITLETVNEQLLKADPFLSVPSAATMQVKLNVAPVSLLVIYAIQVGILLLILGISSALCAISEKRMKRVRHLTD
ncbi:MAG TPA: hypothetical protein PLK23_05720 [Clostridia bacterium]|mgnify:FL=1|jgi:hypothetical protein|nr:hypothetical protein [Clostridiaceae bacterium]HOF26505.1 hypothetical protein [Clostridia bacterium]HOM34465.1 hypothetical protein [Clostridia bacterium]HOR90429.1 hypothetical protein [Clostridia bacterium]HOT71514.1 hypothetical protein [Clostridia bacterium]